MKIFCPFAKISVTSAFEADFLRKKKRNAGNTKQNLIVNKKNASMWVARNKFCAKITLCLFVYINLSCVFCRNRINLASLALLMVPKSVCLHNNFQTKRGNFFSAFECVLA